MLQDQGTGQPSLWIYDCTTTHVEKLRPLAPVRQRLCRHVDRMAAECTPPQVWRWRQHMLMQLNTTKHVHMA